jgi:hypothetical protein
MTKDEQSFPPGLDALRAVPERDPTRAAAGRQAYLKAVEEMKSPVSSAGAERHIGWMPTIRKERSPMFSFARILIVLTLALGGTGTTAAYASQSSLPGDPLYGVKLALEDLRLDLTHAPEQEVLLLEDLVETRLQEIGAMVQQGMPINPQLTARLENHLRLALQQTAQLDDPLLIQTMQQIQIRAQEQLRILQQLQANAPSNQQDVLRQTEQAILRVRKTAEDAIDDPATFRLRLGNERPEDAPEQPDLTPGQNDGGEVPNGPGEPQGPCQECGGGPNGPNSGGGGK